MSLIEIITVTANIALTLTFVIGLVFGIAQLKAVERERRERLTVEILRAFQTREFAEFVNFLIQGNFPKADVPLSSLSDKEQIMYVQFSQQMESLGILVAENVVDIDLVDKTLGSFVSSAWKRYEPRFTKSRKNDPYLGEYFQWLAERMDEYGSDSPRDPYYMNSKPKK